MARLGVHVFAVEIVELIVAAGTLVKHNLTRPAGTRFVAGFRAQHRTFDLTSVDALLDQHTPIMVGRFEYGGGQFGGVTLAFHLGHAETGTGTGRLDEQRIPQSRSLYRGQHRFAVCGKCASCIVIACIQRNAGGDRNAGGSQQHLRIVLVHASGGGEHTATHVRHVHHFEQTLDGAVLAIRAVQHRQHRVHMAKGGQRTVGLMREETVLAESHVKHHVLGGIGFSDDWHAFAHVPAARILTVDDPLAGFGDADRNRLELLHIQRTQHPCGGDARNRMLIGLAAIHHHNALLSHVPPFD